MKKGILSLALVLLLGISSTGVFSVVDPGGGIDGDSVKPVETAYDPGGGIDGDSFEPEVAAIKDPGGGIDGDSFGPTEKA